MTCMILPEQQRRLMIASGAVLMGIWVIVVFQKYAQYAAHPDYSISASLLFNLVTIVPFLACIFLAIRFSGVTGRFRPATRLLLASGLALILFSAYILTMNAILFLMGLASGIWSTSFVSKYLSTVVHAHVAVYVTVQVLAFPGRQIQKTAPLSKPAPAAVPEIETTILWIESADHYLRFHTTGGTTLERGTMKQLVGTLPSNFVRIHRKHIVNADVVTGIERNGSVVYVKVADHKLRVSHSYRERVLELF